jgi:uncharacterized RDD family membrane protein YckC
MDSQQDFEWTEDEVMPTFELAGWWRRVGATVIDLFVISVFLGILALASDGYHVHHRHGGGLVFHQTTVFTVVSIAIGVIYQATTLCRRGTHNGQTLGDQLLGVTITRDDGRSFGLGTFVVRQALLQELPNYAIRAIPHFGGLLLLWTSLDDLWPLWDRESRALHDIAAHTHALRTRETR